MEVIEKEKWRQALALAKKGHAESQWLVGYHYQYGAVDASGVRLVKADASQALRWFERSAAQGCSAGQCALSNLLSSGEGVPADYEAAIYWAHQAIDQGVAHAAFNLGRIYRDLKKPAMAFRWYERAAALGDNDAYLDLGLCCLFGFGTKQDLPKAYGYFRKVCASNSRRTTQRGRENALYWMAVLDLMGMSGKKSVARARRMLETANADDDHEPANDILNLIGKTR